MNKFFNKRTILICSALPNLVTEEFNLEQYKAARGLFIEDPWERVKIIFSKDDHGDNHPELENAIQMAEVGAIVGFLVGGVAEAANKTEQFIRTNDVNIYQNKREAYKVFANHSLLSFMKGGVRYVPGFCLFFGGFFLISSCCEAYRNKASIIDSTVAGAVVGGISRFMFGLKGITSGGIIGGALGMIYGTVVWGITKIMNVDQMELKYAQFAMSKHREKLHDRPVVNVNEKKSEVQSHSNTNSVHARNPSVKIEPSKEKKEDQGEK